MTAVSVKYTADRAARCTAAEILVNAVDDRVAVVQ